MKRVVFSISYYLPHLSGLTIAVQRVMEHLATTGYSITVLTTQLQQSLPRTEIVHGVQIIRVPFLFKISKGFFMPSLVFQAVAACHKTDVVLVVLPQYEGVLIAFVAKLLRKRLIVWYICEVTLPETFFSQLIERGLRFSHRICLLLADERLTLTKDFARHNVLLKQYSSVVAIPPLITQPRISHDAIKMLQKKIPQKQYTIGFLGRVAHEKGIIYLLKAIPFLQKKFGDDFVIILAGPRAVGEAFYAEEVTQLLTDYATHIVSLGKISEEEKGAFYQLLDVLVLPSINNTEAFGMVQVEAMLCGTPVVASDLPGVRVPVQITGMGEIARIKDTKDLTEKIILILKKREQYEKKRAIAQRVFALERITAQYEALFL